MDPIRAQHPIANEPMYLDRILVKGSNVGLLMSRWEPSEKDEPTRIPQPLLLILFQRPADWPCGGKESAVRTVATHDKAHQQSWSAHSAEHSQRRHRFRQHRCLHRRDLAH